VSSNTARQVYRSMRRRFDERSTDVLPDHVDPRRTSVIAGTRLDLLDALDDLERQHPAAVEAFVLRDLGALPYEEVAALTGAPLGTVKARIHAARRHLRENLSPADNLSGGSRI
jgi:RNA polymerase sigma-70 factor (ECF subfamily)